MDTKTILSTITDAEVQSVSSEAEAELERFIGTCETYGGYPIKPKLTESAIIPAGLLKVG